MVSEAGTGLRASPYKGLAHYEEADARFFFGRERDREIIRANLAARRLTLLYGESGVGKSSVLRAGVVHDLRERALKNIAEGRPPQFVPVVFSSWRDNPVPSLVAAVRRAVAELVGETDDSPTSRLDEALQALASRAGGELLLVLDQFEEYLLYHGDESGEDSFAESFPRAVNRVDLRARFLISIREDALAQLDRFKRRLPRLFENTLRISHLDLEAARAAIEGPIAEYNAEVGSAEAVELEPELVDEVLQQVQSGRVVLLDQQQGTPVANGGPPRFEAPYIQLVMTRLWAEEARRGSRVLRLSTMKELGGAGEIVRTHLDAALDELSPEGREVAAGVLRFLVTRSGAKIAHALPDLAEFTGRSAEELRSVLEQLSSQERRILRPVASQGATGEPRYELYHDVLAPAIIDWRRRFGQAELERQRADAEQRARRERRKARLAAAAAGAFLLLAAFAVAVSVWAIHQKRVAQSERQLARSRALLTAASDQLDKRLDRGISLTLDAYRARPSVETRSALVTAVEQSDRLRRIVAAASPVHGVAFSPDGSRLAVLERDGVVVLDASTGRSLGTAPFAGAQQAAFAPGGKLLAVVRARGRVVLWDIERGRGEPLCRSCGELIALRISFAAGGRRLIAVTESGRVIAWNVRAGKVLSILNLRELPSVHYAHVVDVSRDGTFVAYEPAGGGVAVLKAGGDGGVRLVHRYLTREPVAALAFAPSGHRLAMISAAGELKIADPSTGSVFHLRARGETPTSVALGRRSRVAVGWRDGHIDAWSDVHRGHGSPKVRLAGHGNAVLGLAFSRNGTSLASVGADDLAELWSPWHSSLERRLFGGQRDSSFDEVQFGGQALGAASDIAGSLVLWRTISEHPQSVVAGTGQWEEVAFSADRKWFSGADGNGRLLLYDLESTRHRAIQTRAPYAFPLAFSADSKTLAEASSDGSVRIRNVPTLKPVGSFKIKGAALGLSFDPRGSLLAVATQGRVSIWNLKRHRLDATLITETPDFFDMAFSPDGTLLAYTENGSVVLWDVKHHHPVGSLSGESTTPLSLRFSPDGATLAVGAEYSALRELEGNVSLWDIKSRHRLGPPFEDPHGRVSGIDFSDDGRLLALADGSDAVTVLDDVLWDDAAGMQRRLCSVLARATRACGSH